MSKLMGISLVTMSLLYGLLVAIAVGVSLAFGVSILPALIGGIVVLLLQYLISPWLMDLTTRWLYKANFDMEMPEYLSTYITEVCNKHKIKYPKIGYIDDGAPNAYTYGRTKKDARIILTRGIFELLNPEEVKAVVAHELGHVAHYDMLFMTMAQLIPIVLYAVYAGVSTTTKDSDSDSSKLAMVGYIAYVLYIISQYIVLWLSRTREYYADDFAVNETKSVNHISEALVKIGFGLTTGAGNYDMSKVKGLGIFDKNTSKSLIVSSYKDGMINKNSIKNSMKWEKFNTWAKYYELHSTHPLISKRLLKISSRSRDFNQEPYIVFDLVKEGVSFGTFFLELLLLLAPVLSIFLFVILFVVSGEKTIFIGAGGLVTIFFLAIKFFKRNKKSFTPKTVEELLGEVNVSKVTTIPCILEGKVIGRGDPGGILSEDLVIKDNTGIMFMNYNQPSTLWNKIVALFKTSSYLDTNVKIKGWYMRGPVPYVEIFTMEVNGKTKKIYSYYVKLVLLVLGAIASVFLMLLA